MSHEQAVSRPVYRSAPLAYGWARAGRAAHLVPEEMAIRATIVQLFHIGYGFREIATFLNDDGYLGRNGSPWQAMVIQRIIMKPVPRELLNLIVDQTSSLQLHASLVSTFKPAPVTITREITTREEKRAFRRASFLK